MTVIGKEHSDLKARAQRNSGNVIGRAAPMTHWVIASLSAT